MNTVNSRELSPFNILCELHCIRKLQVLHVLRKVCAHTEKLLDGGEQLGAGEETVVETAVEEVSVFGEDLVNGDAVGDGGDEGVTGWLHHLHTHVVGQVLYQV